MKDLFIALVLIVSLGVVGCSSNRTAPTQQIEQYKTENQQRIHLKTTPPPILKNSLERKNLIKRLERFNNESKVSYIYLVNYGRVMAFYLVKGKVSSVNSLLTTPEQMFRTSGMHTQVVASPALDGSYGTNGDAIFFFTTDDTYIEWAGDYMLCDKPLKLSTPPVMMIHVEDK